MDNILLWFRGYKNNYELALRVIVALIILVLFLALLGTIGAMTAVILDYDIKADIMDYTGYTNEKDKPELIRLIGWGMGSIAVALGSVVTFLWISASKDKHSESTKKGHIRDSFNEATKKLGNKESDSDRIASFNEFYHIAETEPDKRKTIFDLLCSHLRQITKDKDYLENINPFIGNGTDIEKYKGIQPTEEVQNLLGILIKPLFDDLTANLRGVNLLGANLVNAKGFLQNADMLGAQIDEEYTKMPPNWLTIVEQYKEKDGSGNTSAGVIVLYRNGEPKGRV